MNVSRIVGFLVAGIVVACISFIIVLFLVKWLWAWTIPDLFPGAVGEGLVAAEISWLTAIKLSLFIAVISALLGGSTHSPDHKRS